MLLRAFLLCEVGPNLRQVLNLHTVDWHSRRVLGWRISNTIETVFCVDCLEGALREQGKPEVFSCDQGGSSPARRLRTYSPQGRHYQHGWTGLAPSIRVKSVATQMTARFVF